MLTVFNSPPTGRLLGIIVIVVAALFFGATTAHGQSKAEPLIRSSLYLFVATNDRDENQMGPWPLDRGRYAEAIARARAGGAKAVILKFFLDRPSTLEADTKLAEAIASMPVYLQFAFGGGGEKIVEQRVWRNDLGFANLPQEFHQLPSLLPLPLFQQNAAGLGFVDPLPDADFNRISLLGASRGGIAASLYLLSLEASLGQQAFIRERRLTINAKSYEIAADGRVVCPYLEVGRPQEYSLFDFLAARVPETEVRNRVVLIGNTRHDTPHLTIPNRVSMPVHEVFFRQVLCLEKFI